MYNNCFLTLRAGEQVLLSQRRRIMTPGEMATAKLSPQMLEALKDHKELRLEISAQKQGA